MAIPKHINSSNEGFPVDVEFALRSLHKKFGSSIVDPTPFNVALDASKHAMKHDTPCKVSEFPRAVIMSIITLKASRRYLAPLASYAQAIAEIEIKARL